VCRDGAKVTSTGRSFHVRVPATRKARRPIVGSLIAGTSRSSDEEDRNGCRDGMSAIGVNCHRHCGHRHQEPDKSVYSDLENNPFSHSQPTEADECIRNMIRSTETEYQCSAPTDVSGQGRPMPRSQPVCLP